MIFWNRNKKFKFWVSPNEIKENARQYSSNSTVGFHTFFSVLINILAALATYFYFGFNIIAFAIAFVVTDIVLVTAGWFGCYLFPYIATKSLSLIGVQKRVERLTKKRDALEHKIQNGDYRTYDDKIAMSDEIDVIDECIFIEKEYIDTENKKVEEQKIQEDKRTNKDFDNKLEYFENCKNKLKFYINEKKITELKPVKTSLNKLVKVLQERPMGITMIPMTLYIYLDELLTIADKVCSLSENYTEKYSENITKVSELLRANIAELIERIDKCDMDDIEVGLNVLLRELENTEMQEEQVQKIIPDNTAVTIKRTKKGNTKTKKEN